METTSEDSAMRRTHWSVASVGGAFALGGVSFFGVGVGMSVLVGATIASLNLLVLSRTVRGMVEAGGGSWAGVALLKFLVLSAVTYGLIRYQLVGPLALAVGFGSLPFGIVLAGMWGASSGDSFGGGEPAEATHPPLGGTSNIESDHA